MPESETEATRGLYTDDWEDYEKEIATAVDRLETGDHDMFTLITGTADDIGIETSVLTCHNEDELATAEDIGEGRFSMLNAMFWLVISNSNLEPVELFALLTQGSDCMTTTHERKKSL